MWARGSEKTHRGLAMRRYDPSDCKCLVELFYQIVHTVNARDYTDEQLDVWATGKEDLERWDRTFCDHHTVVAVKDGRIVGFGDIDKTGYLDRLYVHKDHQRQGIGAAICDRLENAVQTDKIVVHASITARPFFLSRGYRDIKEQKVSRQGISLTNYIMER